VQGRRTPWLAFFLDGIAAAAATELKTTSRKKRLLVSARAPRFWWTPHVWRIN
jgi:hypothetical protein